MMPPGKQPSKRPGSKDPAAGAARPASKTPGTPPSPPGKPVSKPVPKPGTPSPTPAGKPPKVARAHAGAPLRRTGPPMAGSRKKPNLKLIAIVAVASIVAIIGILFGILSGQVDPEKVKAELKAKIDEIEKLGPDQVIEKHKRLKELQANPAYKVEICGAVRKALDSAEEAARRPAEIQQKADEDAKPFIEKYPGTSGLDQTKAQNLLDQVSSLIADYLTTTHGPKLEEIKKELLSWLEANTSTDSPEGAWPEKKRESDRLAKDGDYKRASKIVEDFERQYSGKLSSTLQRLVDEQRTSLKNRLRDFIKDRIGKAKEMHERGQTSEAQEVLRKAIEGTEGLEGSKELESALKSIGG